MAASHLGEPSLRVISVILRCTREGAAQVAGALQPHRSRAQLVTTRKRRCKIVGHIHKTKGIQACPGVCPLMVRRGHVPSSAGLAALSK